MAMPVTARALRQDYERLMARSELLLTTSRDLMNASRGMCKQSQTVRDAVLTARKGWTPRILKLAADR
jgi:flagellar biosynthesis regulator FlaF